MSAISRVIPLVRTRSSSPVVINPIANVGSTRRGSNTVRSRTPPLRTISPVTANIATSGSDHGLGGSRGYASAFLGLRDGPADKATVSVSDVGNKSLARRLSDLAQESVPVPEPPSSNHPHKPIPGATGQLIYTET